MDFSRDMNDDEVYTIIDETLTGFPERRMFDFADRIRLRKEIFNSLRKLDVIQEYLEDEAVTEIMINGTDGIFVEKNGKVFKSEKKFASPERLADIVQQIVAGCNRSVNEASPIADARLKTGERVNIVLPPISLNNGPIVTLRRFPDKPITMERLIEIGSMSQDAADFIKKLVVAGYNIFISGGTGSGKTTFLNALSQYIPSKERIITIEDSAELRILDAENLVRLETRAGNMAESKPISIRDLIRSALRMRPERIIVGECRGEEALDMLQAMNTGHDGSLSTGHANSAKDMIARLETMVIMGADIPIQAIRSQIASGIDIIVHLGRLRDGTRKVLEIAETNGVVSGEVELNRLYFFDRGELKKVGELIHKDKLYRTYGEDCV
ncbi:MAG: CpaF family protein [Lachnospiraceae bacterium]|nr:CpaF family protein [Lachnospiraceae bacterium]